MGVFFSVLLALLVVFVGLPMVFAILRAIYEGITEPSPEEYRREQLKEWGFSSEEEYQARQAELRKEMVEFKKRCEEERERLTREHQEWLKNKSLEEKAEYDRIAAYFENVTKKDE
ncbi:MAG: hypothetical protein FWG80_00725 [Alphaproteobacteria bacterium]|nr:hypothetical protein [Alphaproteobacteria bacterium]